MSWYRVETPNTHYGHTLEQKVGRRTFRAWENRDGTWSVRYWNGTEMMAQANRVPSFVVVRIAIELADRYMRGQETTKWFADRTTINQLTGPERKAIFALANKIVGPQ